MDRPGEREREGSPVGYALIGAGAFGAFCLDAYGELDEVRPVAVADANPEAARRLAEPRGLKASSVDDLLADPEVGLVHLATPPSTHRDLAVRAFAAGKHVLCEKPLATEIADAEAIVAAAKAADRLLAVNLIMRYDPLLRAVGEIVARGLLGRPLRATFENYAKDAALGPDHWFWKPELSGGIFVEHAVHFLTLFDGWFGPGEAECAFRQLRPGTETIEAVGATVRHRPPGGDVVAQAYHGFTQAEAMDRQEMRLLFERGDIRLDEWVPTRLRADFFGTGAQADELAALLPQVESRSSSPLPGPIRHRWDESPSDARFVIEATNGMDKDALYRKVVRDLLADGLAWTRDRTHRRLVTEDDALASLRTAVRLREMAR